MTDKFKTILRSTVLFLILLFPNLYACVVSSDLSSPSKTVSYLIVVIAGLILPMLFLRRRTYFIVLGVVCLFIAPIEIASLYLNHNPSTVTFVGLFYATNPKEVTGIIGAIWPLLIMLIAIWILYFLLAYRQPNERIIPLRIGLWTAGIGIPVLFASAIHFYSRYARNIYHMQDTREVLSLAKDLTLMKFYKIFPYNIYLNSTQIAIERHQMRQAQKALTPFRFGIQSPNHSTPELYVLIIGESARSENFALNGYERPTTPRLQQQQNIVAFPNIYSQAGTTEQSVPHMISRIPATHHKEVYTEKTLPEAFQEAGFEASWLTNKSRAQYLQRIMDCMDRRFETGKDMSVTNNYDELLLMPFKDVLSAYGKQFVVIHTMGSHWRYDTRYPSQFELFTPSLGKDFQLTMISPENRQKMVNAYDNTILYTDYFIDSLISMTEEQQIPAVILYISDHGENLYDDERGLILHGNYSASKWLFHVPLIVWYSDAYEALHPEKIAALHAHANSRDNSSVVFHSMIDAAGLRYTNDTAGNATMRTRSIFSSSYCPLDTLFALTAEGECIALEY